LRGKNSPTSQIEDNKVQKLTSWDGEATETGLGHAKIKKSCGAEIKVVDNKGTGT